MLLEWMSPVEWCDLTGDIGSDVNHILIRNGRPDLLKHVTEVAETNLKIAHKYCLEPLVCEQSALLHDLAGLFDPGETLIYFRRNHLMIDPAEEKYPFLLHQRSSAILAEEVFGISDQRVLSAIAHHTTLKANPTEYEMALFISDKLSWDQKGTPPFYETVSHALDRSLYHASLAYISYMFEHHLLLSPHSWMTDAYRWLAGYCQAL